MDNTMAKRKRMEKANNDL